MAGSKKWKIYAGKLFAMERDVYPTPVEFVKSRLLSVPGLSDRDIFYTEKYVDIHPDKDGTPRLTYYGVPVHLREAFDEMGLTGVLDAWVEDKFHALGIVVAGPLASLQETGLPCKGVWVPKGWSLGLSHLHGMEVREWDRPSVMVSSGAPHWKSVEVPFDFEGVGDLSP